MLTSKVGISQKPSRRKTRYNSQEARPDRCGNRDRKIKRQSEGFATAEGFQKLEPGKPDKALPKGHHRIITHPIAQIEFFSKQSEPVPVSQSQQKVFSSCSLPFNAVIVFGWTQEKYQCSANTRHTNATFTNINFQLDQSRKMINSSTDNFNFFLYI